MALKVVFVLTIISLIWINSGESFVRPRPGFVEFSQDFGFVSFLKRMFGFGQETNPVHEQLALWRKKKQCARWAQKYPMNLPGMEEICLKNLLGQKEKGPRKVYDWNIGF